MEKTMRDRLAPLTAFLLALALAACSGGSGGTPSPGTSLATDAKVILLHHSTGGIIWGGGVADGLTAYDASNAKSYAIAEQAYPDSPYPWQNYPYDYWHLWVEGGGQASAEGLPTLESLVADYDVIVFKHCFPVSGIEADTGLPDITSQVKSLENYKLQYQALKERLHRFPGTRFIVWTGAALLETESTPEQGFRARQFFDWVKNVWDEPNDNIFIWDFYELETEGGNFLKPGYSAGDSHPSGAFASSVAPLFANRLVDVIAGRGDTGSITGK